MARVRKPKNVRTTPQQQKINQCVLIIIVVYIMIDIDTFTFLCDSFCCSSVWINYQKENECKCIYEKSKKKNKQQQISYKLNRK